MVIIMEASVHVSARIECGIQCDIRYCIINHHQESTKGIIKNDRIFLRIVKNAHMVLLAL